MSALRPIVLQLRAEEILPGDLFVTKASRRKIRCVTPLGNGRIELTCIDGSTPTFRRESIVSVIRAEDAS